MFQCLTGDCREKLAEIPDSSVTAVVTSPPYADARKKHYNGPPGGEYVGWFLPIAEQVRRILRPDGTFVINIKEKVVAGERHTYVLELIQTLKQQGWLWTEEWIWHKRNCFPGKWPNRFRDAWERCLQFNKNKHFKMNQDAVMVPVGGWAGPRLKNLNGEDKTRRKTRTGSPFDRNVSNWVGRDKVYPTNVLHFATECNNTGHPASFPEELPEFFIKLFSDPGDTVLDPFMGGGTTGLAAVKLGRHFIGVDLDSKYSAMAAKRIEEALCRSKLPA